MCRLAAYIGPEISLDRFLVQPEHGLMRQAWAPEELRYARVNADGYGFGWFRPDGMASTYVNPQPIWSDPNLENLSGALSAPLWIANVRSATHGLAVNHANTQPFNADGRLFLHNGFIEDFAQETRFLLEQEVDREILADVHGTTDSEILFALYRQKKHEQPDADDATILAKVTTLVKSRIGKRKALLNMLVASQSHITVVRSAINDLCPSLYCCSEHPDFPGGHLVASERFDKLGNWREIEPGHTIIMRIDGSVSIAAA